MSTALMAISIAPSPAARPNAERVAAPKPVAARPSVPVEALASCRAALCFIAAAVASRLEAATR
jgi:hypothetical protein